MHEVQQGRGEQKYKSLHTKYVDGILHSDHPNADCTLLHPSTFHVIGERSIQMVTKPT